MARHFRCLEVYYRARGGTIIRWRTASALDANDVYTVWYSESGVGDWLHVATVVGGDTAVDIGRRAAGVSLRSTYRVDHVVDGVADESMTRIVGGILGKPARLVAAKILADEYTLMRHRTGTAGMLWKRRHGGQRCSCTDPDTGEATNSHCLQCYGTGIAGGYYRAVPYTFALSSPDQRKIATSDNEGTVGGSEGLVGRSLICPQLDARDIWVNCATDERYVVGVIRTTLYAGVPLLYEAVELTPIPAADARYALPLDGAPEEMSGRIVIDRGLLLLYDDVRDGFYPVGLHNGAFTVYSAPAASYRVVNGMLLLLDYVGGVYRPVGLRDGAFEVYASTSQAGDAAVDLSAGRLMLWDRTAERLKVCGLSNGAFTVYEESA